MSEERGLQARGPRLDAAIDGAVRQMLDVDQPAGLRGRVLQRIRSRGGRDASVAFAASAVPSVASGFRRKLLWSSLPLAAAAVLILAVIAPWRTSAPVPGPAAPQVTANGPRAAAPRPALNTVPPAPAPSRRAARPRQHPPAPSALAMAALTPSVPGGRTIAAAVASEDGIEIDPLATIDPIRIALVGPAAIEHTEVVVPPLAAVAPLQTAPLSAPDGRF